MGHFLASLLGKIFADELKAWLPCITERLTNTAVRRLPKNKRARYSEEWHGHLSEIPDGLARIWVACGFLRAARKVSRARRNVVSRLFAAILFVFVIPLMAVIFLALKIGSRGPAVITCKHVSPSGRIARLSSFCVAKPIPAELVLRRSLQPVVLTESGCLYARCHYSSWYNSRLMALEEFLVRSRLFVLPMLFDAMDGKITMGMIRSEFIW